jgi:xanthine dehydrogenase accessory factor
LLAVCEDGVVSGSVSGGCVEIELIARTKASFRSGVDVHLALKTPSVIAYGVTREEAARFGLPCGGTLRLVQEPMLDSTWVSQFAGPCTGASTGGTHIDQMSRASPLL